MSSPTLHTSSHGDWSPQHAWAPGATHISGTFEDGTRVELATQRDAAVRAHQQQAWNEWLHGRVLVVNHDNSTPVLVLPVDELSEGAIRVAVTAWATGHASTAA